MEAINMEALKIDALNMAYGKQRIAVIILAAGFSSRMKSLKPLLPLGSVSAMEAAVRSFQRAGFKDIRVVLGHKAAELLPLCASLQIKPVFNEKYAEGMFSSLKAGVENLGPESEGFFLLPVDNPIFQEETLHRLYEAFCLGPEGIIHPVYQGKRGHPPLISRKYIECILNWEGDGGLRALLHNYPTDAREVPVEDQGVLLDMDTPEAYRKILEYCGYAPIPTEYECYEFLRTNSTPQKVIQHCERVAQVSVRLGKELCKAGLKLDLGLISASGLLHDIARHMANHPQEGAKLMAAYPEVADIIEAHMDSQWDSTQPLTEKEIVYMVDKLVADTQIIPLQERLNRTAESHRNEPEALRNIYQRFYRANLIRCYMEEILGGSIYAKI